MTATTSLPGAEYRPIGRRGTRVERSGWILPALLSLVMIVFGLQVLLLEPPRDMVISGSGCCNGHRLSEITGWSYEYMAEIARYMGTFMLTSGVLFLCLFVALVRRGVRWAWYVGWLMPALFAHHAFVLGAVPFDVVTMAISAAGLLLMVRPVLGSRD
jgi:hypothetical protein